MVSLLVTPWKVQPQFQIEAIARTTALAPVSIRLEIRDVPVLALFTVILRTVNLKDLSAAHVSVANVTYTHCWFPTQMPNLPEESMRFHTHGSGTVCVLPPLNTMSKNGPFSRYS